MWVTERAKSAMQLEKGKILWRASVFLFLFQVVFLTATSKPHHHKRHAKPKATLSSICGQVGEPETNVTLMYGLEGPKVERFMLGHFRNDPLNSCVEAACKRENVSVAYTSRYDCYGLVCHGEEEVCWFLPSFDNPSLVFARLQRGANPVKVADKRHKKHKKHRG